MDQRSDSIRQDMRDIAETRAAMTEKLEQLEERVQDTVQDAKTTVLDVVDHVRDAADAFVDRAEEFVEHTKQTFDPTYQVSRHPWMMLGGAIIAGYVLGTLEQRSSSGRPVQRRLPYREFESQTSNPSRQEWEGPNVWDGIVSEVKNEIEHTKGALLEVGKTFVHDFFQEVLPALLAPLREGRRDEPGRSRSYGDTKENGSSFSRRNI
ncbi:MAG TPA: hypothetical protein VJ692_00565 [Nitrospiraceae bacterium]|nr:hypothetical protein [Nitrospiraceae bacterium]